ncbi:MAG: OpgC domain-containing protein [Acetobacteraceae bacterium]|jgi:hypothetical protein|nr:OpgC domain-containing protein [Acetobacteraceae bacterium]
MTAPIALTQNAFLARCAARGTGRDRAIDIARGIALFVILNTHFSLLARDLGTLNGFRAPLLSDLQLPDFADFFVFLSGYVYGLVYARRHERDGFPTVLRQTARRIGQILRAMLVTIAIVVALSWPLVTDEGVLRTLALTPFGTMGRKAFFDFLTFAYAPLFINILCLYVLLLLVAPLMLWGFRRSIAATLGMSLFVWLLVQLGPLDLDTKWAGFDAFNPFAWQLLFGLGIFLGMQRGFDTLISSLTTRQVVVLSGLCLAFLVLRVAIRLSPDLAGVLQPLIHKGSFATLRLLNFLCLAPVFVLFVAWADRALPALMGWFARLGALSLEMFCAGVVLTMLMGITFVALGGGVTAYCVVLSGGLLLYVLSVKPMELLS